MEEEIKLRQTVRQCDVMVILSLLMFIGMRIAIVILFSMTAEETGAEIEAVHTAYEANPIFSAIMRLRMTGYVLQFVVIPAVAFSIYYLFRRKVLYEYYPIDPLQYHVLFTFFFILLNFVNDVAALAGKVL